MSRDFEKMDIWKRACRLSVNVCMEFKKTCDFIIRDQIVRSAISVPSNIAEGAERNSDKEFLQFLSIAKGSCGELRTQLYICCRLYPERKPIFEKLALDAKEISKMLHAFMQVHRTRNVKL